MFCIILSTTSTAVMLGFRFKSNKSCFIFNKIWFLSSFDWKSNESLDLPTWFKWTKLIGTPIESLVNFLFFLSIVVAFLLLFIIEEFTKAEIIWGDLLKLS